MWKMIEKRFMFGSESYFETRVYFISVTGNTNLLGESCEIKKEIIRFFNPSQ